MQIQKSGKKKRCLKIFDVIFTFCSIVPQAGTEPALTILSIITNLQDYFVFYMVL